MQLVGEVTGQISDALHNSGVNGFDETKLFNDWGRILLEATGSAAVAGVTGGNVGAATGSSIAGTASVAAMGQFIADNAVSLAGGDEEAAKILTNLGMNIVAGGASAAAGAAVDGGSGAFNGVSIGSALQQYNAAGGRLVEKLVEGALKAAQKAAQLSGNKTLINLTKDINKIDDVVETIEHSAVGKKIQEGSDAILDAESKAADKIKDVVTGEKTSNASPELTAEQQQIIENADNVSTADPSKGTYDHPRDLQEQVWWNQVKKNPTEGEPLDGKNDDPRFPESAGFKKMQARYKNTDGKSISIHYQFNSITGRVYDMKVTSPQRVWNNPTDVMNAMKGVNK
ncbi:hypothetical protein [Commensalibacter nepenthis]|uniref:Uncharacterized protein n=1 Tax=Commensalibacter nepenthis TaxID=3043872 RepID=A0ABT6Q4E9_9PROT|nr:hypothetical protein [Commensalibacter sp. TBRC 10068]MDI2111771.1 hypothetical protein [Commensalibacter sp. TBRC 10068]